MNITKLFMDKIKHPNHLYYFVVNGELYEAYKTIRAQRSQFVCAAPEHSDSDRVEEDENLLKLIMQNVK